MFNLIQRSILFVVPALVLSAASASAQIKLYWTSSDATGAYIVRSDADGSNPTPIVSGAEKILGPNGLETANGLLYWPDQQLGSIQQANLDGSGVTRFASANNPYDVFGIGEKIYWNSQTANYIDAQLTNGTGYTRIFAAPVVDRPIAIEVTTSHIYWAELGNSGSLRRSNLDGSNAVTLVSNVDIRDIQVTSNYIYFADVKFPGGALKRANLDGTGVVKLVTAPFGGVYLISGICVVGDAIYWSEYNVFSGGGIRRTKLDGSNQVEIFNAPPGTGIRGVVALSDAVSTAPAAPRFTNAMASNKVFSYTLTVEAGRTYRVETSENLTQWTVTTNFVSSGTSVTLTNAIPVGGGHRFYRAVTP